MKKNILVKGPVLSRSGYGYQSRFALKALQTREDIFNIYIQNIPWGKTSWIYRDDEFRRWIDDRILKTIEHAQGGGFFDMSLQITIPNEWEKIAPVNIGYTAGIESSKVAPLWLQKGNEMDNIIVVSNHAKYTYENTSVKAQDNNTGKVVDYKLKTNIDVVNYSTVECDKEPIPNFELTTDFNFLNVSQWGPRKNIENTIRWWVEEFKDEPRAGLIIKANYVNDSLMDYKHLKGTMRDFLAQYPDRKCKVYILHGDMSREQMSWLYSHEKVKANINIAHAEGFGLPIFEAAYHGMPNITIGWSGQMDYLRHNNKDYFSSVRYTIGPIQDQAVWNGVLEKDSLWAYADEDSYKQKCRDMFERHDHWKSLAIELKEKSLDVDFTDDKLYSKFVDHVAGDAINFEDEIDKLFSEVSGLGE